MTLECTVVRNSKRKTLKVEITEGSSRVKTGPKFEKSIRDPEIKFPSEGQSWSES